MVVIQIDSAQETLNLTIQSKASQAPVVMARSVKMKSDLDITKETIEIGSHRSGMVATSVDPQSDFALPLRQWSRPELPPRLRVEV